MLWYIVLVNIICVKCVQCFLHVELNNVCKTFEDYRTIYTNKNCWYNPDIDSSPRLIAKRYGYPFETHHVTTKDGYILTLHRIPSSYKSNSTRKKVIMIQHGLGGSSAFWILQGKRSPAFFLADNGYDVWLSNSRGNYYSTKHLSMTMEDPSYWNFGLHEMAIYDLPASIDFIANKTGKKGNLIYAGHSMGTTISYIYSVVEKEHADANLKAIMSFAPVAYMKNVMGTFKLLAPIGPFLADILTSKGVFAVAQFHELQKNILKLTCGQYPLIKYCNLMVSLTNGNSMEQQQPELLPVFLSFYPSAISIKTLRHFLQIINNNGRFQQYDYNAEQNLKLYNSTMPPDYNISSISIPVHLFVGSKDLVGNMMDADILRNEINAGKANTQAWKYVFPYAHNDFFLAKDLEPFYQTLLQVTQTKSN